MALDVNRWPPPNEIAMPANQNLLRRITAYPDVFGGKPIVRDMRISVELTLILLSQGATQEELLDDYPADWNWKTFGPVSPTSMLSLPRIGSTRFRWPRHEISG